METRAGDMIEVFLALRNVAADQSPQLIYGHAQFLSCFQLRILGLADLARERRLVRHA